MNSPDAAPFAEPWQAQAFAMTVLLHERGVFGWSEWAQALGREIASAPDKDYYLAWLDALEALLIAKGVAAAGQLPALAQAWTEAAEATPHGRPIALQGDWRGLLRTRL